MNERSLKAPLLAARLAGVAYLAVIASGIFAEAFARSAVVVRGDAQATAQNLLASEFLHRTGFVADIGAAAAYVAVTALLYVVLRPASRTIAVLGLCFGLVGSGVMAVNMLNVMQPLLWLDSTVYLQAFTDAQRQALAYTAFRSHALGYNVSIVFFGCHLLLLGYAVIKARFLPTFVGVLLAIAGAFYVANSVTIFLTAQALPYALLPGLIGEGALALWLVVVGVNAAKWREQAAF